MPTLSTVVLSIKGEPRKANISLTDSNEINIDLLQKYLKKKDVPEIVYQTVVNNKHIFLFGYKKGKKGTENKSKFPVEMTIYGDAIVIVSNTPNWERPFPFTIDQWNNLFEKSVVPENKEEEDEEDEEEEEEEDLEDISDDETLDNEDDYNKSESDIDSIKEEEPEELPQPVKRRRAPVYKVDPNIIKEDVTLDSLPDSNKIRMACIQNLEFLKNHFSEEQIRSLERSIFEVTFQYAQKNYVVRNWNSPQFINIYKQNFRSVISNIHPESPVNNPRLLHRVLEGEFKLSAIPFMSSYEMFPEKWFELKDKQIQREQKILEGNKSRATDQFKCRRCNKRECTYYELQTRSADEPMTIFITCLNCGKEWRQG